mmetsp:Transcript_31571/g.75041  ORF Transcript_31571/g.75041 Transcript_31571/m.75041 type:complete len:484 (+) Transcript_31571:82-1533(+)
MEAEVCKSCGSNSVVLDPSEGFKVCEACGFMAEPEAQDLVSQQGCNEPLTGVLVRGGFHANPSNMISWQNQCSESVLEAYRASLAEKCRRFAHSLHLPKYLHSEACGYLDELLGSKPATGIYVDVAAVCCVYITARLHELPVILQDVAAATQFSPRDIGLQCQSIANILGLRLPPLNLRSLLHKVAAECPGLFPGGGRRRAGAAPAASSEAVHLAERAIDFVQAAEACENRHPPAVVAACIVLAAEALAAEVDVQRICDLMCIQVCMCTRLVKLVRAELLKAAEGSAFLAGGPKPRRTLPARAKEARDARVLFLLRHVDVLIEGVRSQRAAQPSAAAAARARPERASGKRKRLLPALAKLAERLLPSGDAGGSARAGEIGSPAGQPSLREGSQGPCDSSGADGACGGALAPPKPSSASADPSMLPGTAASAQHRDERWVRHEDGCQELSGECSDDPEIMDEEIEGYLCSAEETELREMNAYHF